MMPARKFLKKCFEILTSFWLDFRKLSQNKPVVVHFWASWADQCAQMDEVLKALVELHQGKVVFGRCEAEEVSDLATRFNISAVPTVLLVKGTKKPYTRP